MAFLVGFDVLAILLGGAMLFASKSALIACQAPSKTRIQCAEYQGE